MNDQIAQALPKSAPLDRLHRPLRRLRISVTDRCNLRCTYCMPEDQYNWLKRRDLLTFEEITSLTSEFMALGVNQVRLTGGEPLLRRGLDVLISKLVALPKSPKLAMTTNGSLLEPHATQLRNAGLGHITVSLDTLVSSRYRALTGRDELKAAQQGIRAAQKAGYSSIKLNMVVMRGFNDDELASMLKFAASQGAELRFIEYMDVGNTNQWKLDEVYPAKKILDTISSHYDFEPVDPGYRGEVAARYRYTDIPVEFGLINSITKPFCSDCNRARLSADGKLYTCLFASDGHDLKALVRSQIDEERIVDTISKIWMNRHDRYSEKRASGIQDSNKIEMSYIGG